MPGGVLWRGSTAVIAHTAAPWADAAGSPARPTFLSRVVTRRPHRPRRGATRHGAAGSLGPSPAARCNASIRLPMPPAQHSPRPEPLLPLPLAPATAGAAAGTYHGVGGPVGGRQAGLAASPAGRGGGRRAARHHAGCVGGGPPLPAGCTRPLPLAGAHVRCTCCWGGLPEGSPMPPGEGGRLGPPVRFGLAALPVAGVAVMAP